MKQKQNKNEYPLLCKFLRYRFGQLRKFLHREMLCWRRDHDFAMRNVTSGKRNGINGTSRVALDTYIRIYATTEWHGPVILRCVRFFVYGGSMASIVKPKKSMNGYDDIVILHCWTRVSSIIVARQCEYHLMMALKMWVDLRARRLAFSEMTCTWFLFSTLRPFLRTRKTYIIYYMKLRIVWATAIRCCYSPEMGTKTLTMKQQQQQY